MHKLMGGAGLVLGHVLQVKGLLQQRLPLDLGAVVPLHCIDHLGGGWRKHFGVLPKQCPSCLRPRARRGRDWRNCALVQRADKCNAVY